MAAVDRRDFRRGTGFEDVDVFTIPHCRMKHLITRTTKQVFFMNDYQFVFIYIIALSI